ncbi:MAG: tetratricopeptide repeat protein, partial [Chloroflexi bacterium]
FHKALQLDPEHAPTYVNRGQAYMHLGMEDLALADFNKAIELDPELIAAYFNRAVAYIQLDETDKAAADLTLYLRLAKDEEGRHQAQALLDSLANGSYDAPASESPGQ